MASGPGSGDKTSNTAEIPRGLINRSGNPIGRGSRLTSVRGGRDVTLGGIQRKVFTPNLAAVKKASVKDEASKQSAAVTKPKSNQPDSSGGRGRGKPERARGRGRGRGRGDDRFIQLQSEFAFGPMGSSAPGSSRGRGGGGGGGGGGGEGGTRRGATIETDISSMKISMNQVKEENDDKMFDALMRDDFISDLSSGDPHMTPIRLPLGVNQSTKPELKVKEEKMEMDDDETDHVQAVNSSLKRNVTSQPSDVREIINESKKTEKGELVFIQLPDTLPGLPISAVSEDRPKATTSTSKADELSQRMNMCQLKDCNEGYMGKLRIRKSGKAELVLGDNTMEVLPGVPINFHQELVSMHTNDNPGQMIVLGQVNHKLIVTPDYSTLINRLEPF